ncbi:hypothetical protein LX36DRAFT_650022 [Colletotrichum falcatum]|nr:hypothetical protein LX36DRAFT_650022 [Colletotrichum falcatum]
MGWHQLAESVASQWQNNHAGQSTMKLYQQIRAQALGPPTVTTNKVERMGPAASGSASMSAQTRKTSAVEENTATGNDCTHGRAAVDAPQISRPALNAMYRTLISQAHLAVKFGLQHPEETNIHLYNLSSTIQYIQTTLEKPSSAIRGTKRKAAAEYPTTSPKRVDTTYAIQPRENSGGLQTVRDTVGPCAPARNETREK